MNLILIEIMSAMNETLKCPTTTKNRETQSTKQRTTNDNVTLKIH